MNTTLALNPLTRRRIYLPPGSREALRRTLCVSCSERGQCTASEQNYVLHCCRICAETNGRNHSEACSGYYLREIEEGRWLDEIPRFCSVTVQNLMEQSERYSTGVIYAGFVDAVLPDGVYRVIASLRDGSQISPRVIYGRTGDNTDVMCLEWCEQ